MEKTIHTQDVLLAVAQDMASANAELQEGSTDKFNRAVLVLIQQEIEMGKTAAASWKYICPGSHEYTYTHPFPLAIYEAMSEDFLIQLEASSIYIYKNPGMNNAVIRIVFHF